eukprot:8154725-Pyramimonas_sp.AAC.3
MAISRVRPGCLILGMTTGRVAPVWGLGGICSIDASAGIYCTTLHSPSCARPDPSISSRGATTHPSAAQQYVQSKAD